MQCKFVYDKFHPKVQKFKIAEGTRCKLEAIEGDDRGYCQNHLPQSGLMTPDEIKEYGEVKYKRNQARRDQIRLQKNEKLTETDSKIADRRLASLRDALTIQDFDLKEFYAFSEQIGTGGFDNKYRREWCFAHWLNANPETRIPQTLEEVASILGVTEKYLRDTRVAPRIERYTQQLRVNMVLNRCEPSYLAWMVDGVEHGDKDAIKEFVKLRDKKLEKEKPIDDDPINPDILKAAEEINTKDGEFRKPNDSTVADAVGWNEEDGEVDDEH